MVRRRTADAGFRVKLGCHVFRATGITAYLEAGGTLESAQFLARFVVRWMISIRHARAHILVEEATNE
jgi:hypothetical protein